MMPVVDLVSLRQMREQQWRWCHTLKQSFPTIADGVDEAIATVRIAWIVAPSTDRQIYFWYF